jgi:hypothetical protein
VVVQQTVTVKNSTPCIFHTPLWWSHTSIKLSLPTTWRYTGEVHVELHSCLTSALDRDYVINFTLRPLYPRERRLVPIEKVAGWLQSRYTIFAYVSQQQCYHERNEVQHLYIYHFGRYEITYTIIFGSMKSVPNLPLNCSICTIENLQSTSSTYNASVHQHKIRILAQPHTIPGILWWKLQSYRSL